MEKMRAALICGAAVVGLALPAAAAAQQRTFNLEQQSGSRSIPEFARQAGVRIVAPGRTLSKITTPRLVGSHDVREALRKLLAGTGLRVVSDNGTTITLANADVGTRMAPTPARVVAQTSAPVAAPSRRAVPAPATETGPDEVPDGEEIIVTGSRVERSAVAAASPVTTLSDKRIMNSGVANIGDLLMQTPSISVGEGSRNSTQVFLNLRGLGVNRTLTVIDGRRRVSGSPVSSAVDMSIYPAALIERVEIVTGGASAIYGADAVTGAVNVILKRDFEGLQANGRVGVTGEGGSKDYVASVIGGGRFVDGRGSVTLGVAYQRVEPLRTLQRRFYRENGDITLSANPKNTGPKDGIFDQIVYTDAVFPAYAYDGVFALGGKRYVVDQGQLRLTRHDAAPNGVFGSVAQGGDGYNNVDFDYLRRQVQTVSAIGRLGYEVADDMRLFVDFEYANKRANSPGVGDFDLGSTIRIDNPFVPQALRDLMIDNGVQQITVTRSSRDQGVRNDRTDADVLTVAGGIEGHLDNGWSYTAFAQHGSYRQNTQTTGRRIAARYAEAIDVISDPVTGDPVCRSATARAAGCLPVNILGETVSSAQALDYFKPVLKTFFQQTQDLAGVQFKGDVLELPAGMVKAAFGGEWRRERLQRQDDALALSGAILFMTGTQPVDAGFEVKEVFGEVVVPLLADRPFFKSLEIEAAARASDYSTIGSTVAWKAGANWAFNDTIRIRGSVARSVRAPNLFELYNPGVLGTIGTLQDPCTAALINASDNRTRNCRAAGVPVGYVDPTIGSTKSLLTGGNRDLHEEKSTSYTAGLILTPAFLPGLTWTTGWWRIRINGATSSIDAQTAANSCYDASSLDNVYCSLIERGGFDRIGNGNAHSITLVRQNVINVGRLDASGVDTQIGYTHALGVGRLQLLFNGTYLLKNELLGRANDPTTLLVEDGEVSNPRFRGTAQVNYSHKPWSIGAVGRFISAAKADQQASREFRDRNDASARFYLDLNLGYGVSESVSLFAGVNNVTAANPPVLPEAVQAARSGLYDALGRVFFLGGSVTF